MIKIREEKAEDYNVVRVINDKSFGQPDEGRIVDKISM
jgi:predicted N-acetyltransferase YhbS